MTFGLRQSLLALVAAVLLLGAAQPSTPVWGYRVVKAYPHDPQAFTQGLFFEGGQFFESTGQKGSSWLRRVELETGKVLQQQDLPPNYFGEGSIGWKDKIVQLTWQEGVGFVWDLKTFEPRGAFAYPGEGWGLTRDDKRLIMSDGTAELRFLDPETLEEIGRVTVTDGGAKIDQLNELEWVEGEVWANIWLTDRIARIDPKTGKVVGWIDLTGILRPAAAKGGEDVLNGIAYDAARKKVYVTGKLWPELYEIELVRKR